MIIDSSKIKIEDKILSYGNVKDKNRLRSQFSSYSTKTKLQFFPAQVIEVVNQMLNRELGANVTLTSLADYIRVPNKPRGAVADVLVSPAIADGIGATASPTTHLNASTELTDLVVVTIRVFLTLGHQCCGSHTCAVRHEDHVSGALAHHGPERLVILNSAYLVPKARAHDGTGLLAEFVDAGMLRGAVTVSTTLWLYLWRWVHHFWSCRVCSC